MSTIKSVSVGNGDLYYINHNTDNFTVIDCNLCDDRRDELVGELKEESADKGVLRFISTHPDEDHIRGICHLDDIGITRNFYCVENDASKTDESESFKRYKELRDDEEKAFHIYRGCSRRWMNLSGEGRGGAGINVLWPDPSNESYKEQLKSVSCGGSPNNISPIVSYSLEDGVVAVWMGDLESGFMEEIIDEVDLPKTDILFAPHHGRKSGHVPKVWLDAMDPKLIVVGEASSEDLCYYNGYHTITQNSAGDIEFDCVKGFVHIRVSDVSYKVDFLKDISGQSFHKKHARYMWYIGSFETHQ